MHIGYFDPLSTDDISLELTGLQVSKLTLFEQKVTRTSVILTWFAICFLDKPNYILPDDTVSKSTQGKWLLDLCESFIDKYVFGSDNIECLVQQTHELELASLGHYNCRVEGCNKVFVYHSGRVRLAQLICLISTNKSTSCYTFTLSLI